MKKGSIRLAILMTCHSRAALTDRALSGLEAMTEGLNSVNVTTFVVDDGSKDDTVAQIRRRHPETVLTCSSEGDLYWAGGMRLAYEVSRSYGDFDGYLLVNDDVHLDPRAASEMITAWARDLAGEAILVGATLATDGQEVTYSGFSERSRHRLFDFERVPPIPGALAPCDTFNANFVVVPGEFFVSHGGLDAAYRHGYADLDLGLDAKRAGVPSFVYPEPVGTCDKGPATATILLRRNRRQRARMLFRHPYSLGPELAFAAKHRPRSMLPLYALRGLTKRIAMCARPGIKVG